ncbi:hypothetical protein D4764_13G0011250 [Takifugu flavidus]|uniref:DUF6729 domain-containing protein n=1 Tax=Takifugu flavidus TaxID=433684 RepID=A0A5C6PAD1_9TELE|nr:hypothetical protein D4764_13G0011250 [Takifugu flavidus]
MVRLRNNDILPCLHSCPRPQVVSAGVGRPRVIVSVRGQYFIFSSRLCCKACRKNWFADNPQWVEKLPMRFTNLFPAFLTYKKAVCKSVMDELRRSGKSPTDMANQVNELMHLKYERAHLAYLHAVQNVRDAEAGAYGQRTIGQYVWMEDRPRASVSGFYLTDCLLDEFKRQQPSLTKLLQGTFGQAFRSDHTRKMARKVTLASGAMSSFAVMNENWLIVSWVMVQAETERSLQPMYQGMAQRYSDAGVEKAGYHWMDRDCCAPFKILDCVPGEHLCWDAWKTTPSIVAEATSGPLTNTCASRAHYNSSIVEDLKRLRDAYEFCGIRPANPTKRHIREHCRTKIPQPTELLERVERVLQHFHLATDANDVPLFKSSMLKMWRIQRQEGYHFQQAQWVTGTQVSPELFQAQAMAALCGGTFSDCDGTRQVPCDRDTGERRCSWRNPSSSWATLTAVPSLPPAPPIISFHLSAAGRVKEIPAEDDQDPKRSVDVSRALPLPLKSSPRSAHTGPIKTGGRVFVLDHTRWTLPMKDAIDSLLQYHHGEKDILRLVDRDYADMVHRSAADPNSVLHPTTRFHISRYVKHLAKLLNTSSSLNTSPEKLLETQQLWYSP